MELEKNYIHKNEVIATAYVQTTVEDDYNLPDYKPDMMKLIDAKGQVELEETRVGSQSVFVQGKLQFFVLYRGESSERGISSLRGEIPFREKINLDGVEELDPVTVKTNVADMGISVINSRKISLRGVLEFTAESKVISDIELPTDVEDDADCEIKKSTRQLLQLLENKRDILRIRQEVSLPKEKPTGSELIWDVVNFEGENMRLVSEGVEISGMAHLCILYQGMEDVPFAWYETTVPVSGILPCQMCASADHYQVKLCGVRPAVQLLEDEDGELRNIALELDLETELSLWKEEEMDFIEDMYSLSRELRTDRSEEQLEQVLIKNSAKIKVSGEMALGELTDAMYLCAGSSSVKIRRMQITEDGVEVQGDMHVEVLCLTTDDDIPVSAAGEVFPFTQVLEAEGIDENSRIDLDAGTEQLQVMLSDAHRAEVRGEVQLNMMVFARKSVQVICSVEEEEPDYRKLQESPGMIGYIVKAGDSLWNIAKEYHTTVEDLRRTNELETDLLQPGQKLLLVKHVMPQVS